MRVAYLVNQYPMVSHIFIRREILALERRGVDVTRIALRGWDASLVDEEDLLERTRTRYVLRDGAFAHFVATLRVLITRPSRFIHALRLAWYIGARAERPRLVHLAYLAEACRIEPWLRASGIEHVHAHFGTNSAAVAMLVHALGGPAWSFTVHGPTEFAKAEFIGLADKIRHCASVVAISSFGQAQLYRFVEHQQWSKVHVVHCGLEPDVYRIPAPLPPADRRLVCVGRLCEQKGQILLVEAARYLVRQGQNFELVLVGDGPMRPEIEAVIKKYELEDTVRLTGRISTEQVREEMLAARALVLPSFAEGLPMVIMEAMALRRPIISTYVAGIPELVISGKHGWLVPAGDVESLAEAMKTCLDSPVDVLGRMGDASFDRVVTRHNADTQAMELEAIFQASISDAEGALEPLSATESGPVGDGFTVPSKLHKGDAGVL
jgi:colanic acid/amylovoran biosynthesis glycosyltransferase